MVSGGFLNSKERIAMETELENKRLKKNVVFNMELFKECADKESLEKIVVELFKCELTRKFAENIFIEEGALAFNELNSEVLEKVYLILEENNFNCLKR